MTQLISKSRKIYEISNLSIDSFVFLPLIVPKILERQSRENFVDNCFEVFRTICRMERNHSKKAAMSLLKSHLKLTAGETSYIHSQRLSTKIWDWAKMFKQTQIKKYISTWPFRPFVKMIHSSGDHFGKRTEWSLIYFLIYAYLNILALSQILVISLYLCTLYKTYWF